MLYTHLIRTHPTIINLYHWCLMFAKNSNICRWGEISHPWLGASHQAACNKKELSQPQQGRHAKIYQGPMFDAPNMAESLNMSSFVPVQGGISSACDIFEYLHLCAFMCLPSAPRQSASQRPRGCVCNAHPCWNDQGVVHKCPGDRKEDSWAVSDLGGDGKNLEIFFENHRVVWSVTNHPIPIWPILIVDDIL